MNAPQSELLTAISRLPQQNYLTATNPGSGLAPFIEDRYKTPELFNVKPNVKNNAGYSGAHGYADDAWVEDWSVDVKSVLDLASQSVGRYLLAALGGYAVSQPDAAGNPTVYKHVFTPLDRSTTVQLPAYTFAQQLKAAAGGINSLYPSNVCDEFAFAANGRGRVEGNTVWTGSGDEISPSGLDYNSQVAKQQNALNYFYFTQAGLKIGGYPNMSAPASYTTCDLLRLGFKVTNDHAKDDYGCPRFKTANSPESGALRSQYLLTMQKFALDWTIKLQANSPFHAALTNRTAVELEAGFTGSPISGTYSHSLKIISYLAKYNSADRGFDNGFATVQVMPELLYSQSDNQIVSVELINNVPSYVA